MRPCDLTPDARLILTAFVEADGPLDWWDMLSKLAPEPKRCLGFVRKAECKAWLDRHNTLIWQEIRLFADGLLNHLPTPDSDLTIITVAGRKALASDAEGNCNA